MSAETFYRLTRPSSAGPPHLHNRPDCPSIEQQPREPIEVEADAYPAWYPRCSICFGTATATDGGDREQMERISFRAPPWLVDELDEFVGDVYPSRSDALRDGMRKVVIEAARERQDPELRTDGGRQLDVLERLERKEASARNREADEILAGRTQVCHYYTGVADALAYTRDLLEREGAA